MTAACPKCGVMFVVADEFMGQKKPCPSCGHLVEIPVPAVQEPAFNINKLIIRGLILILTLFCLWMAVTRFFA